MQIQANVSLGAKLFLSRVLRNPRQLGAIAPSSRHLGELLARHAAVDNYSPIVELGGGTGSLTRAMIKAGIAPHRIYVIELDKALAHYLKETFPKAHVIHGNAAELENILPPHILGNVHRIVSGLPMINIPEEIRQQIIESCFIKSNAYGLKKKRLGTVFLNIPPATVWQYRKC